MKHKRKVKLIY